MWQEPKTTSLPDSFVRNKRSFSLTFQVYTYGLYEYENPADLSLIEGQDGPVEREADGTGRKNSHSRLHHAQGGPVWVHKCDSPN